MTDSTASTDIQVNGKLPPTPTCLSDIHLLGGGLMASRILLTRREAAESLGMSLSHFQRHVQPQLRCVYSGQLRLYRPADLKRWAKQETCQHAAAMRLSTDARDRYQDSVSGGFR